MTIVYDLRGKVVETGRRMLRSGLVHGLSGNVSARVPGEEKIVITPSLKSYGAIEVEDILILDFEGNVVEGERNPSSEWRMHLSIYKARPDVGAVIHTHSVYASALAAVGKSIPPFLDEMVQIIGGSIDVAEYGIPGSEQLAENVVKTLGDRNAVLLSNHGAVCCGKDLDKALEVAEEVERIAKIYVLSMVLGGPKSLPPESVEFQRAVFEILKSEG